MLKVNVTYTTEIKFKLCVSLLFLTKMRQNTIKCQFLEHCTHDIWHSN